MQQDLPAQESGHPDGAKGGESSASAANAPSTPRTAETSTDDTARKFTAVVYVHGMGSQRRYEETARLIDALDRMLAAQPGKPDGILREIQPVSETMRGGAAGKTLTYVKAKLVPAGGGAAFGHARFYESYWAPLMAGQKSAYGILKWIARQAFRPWTTLRAPWNELHRLRRAALADLREQAPQTAGAQPQDWLQLLRLYDQFDKLDRQRDPQGGSFDAFLGFVAQNAAAADIGRLTALAEAWRQHYRRSEWRNGAVLLTMLLGLGLAGLGLIWVAQWLLVQAEVFSTTLGAESVFGQAIAAYLKPGWPQAMAVVSAAAAAVGFIAFLTDYMGDVEIWSTYEETDEKSKIRAEVIEACAGLMQHVLSDPLCARVVVVAHSLGTSVAHDALLSLRKCNLVTLPRHGMDGMTGTVDLKLISHFITMGSPIDKINYFFETVRSQSHRYLRVVETLRGDITTPPFSLNPGKNAKPWVHWINFWDEADVISGPLASPTGRESFANQVDNVHVPCLVFPNPGAAHLAYFGNLRVLRVLFRTIFRNEFSFEALPVVQGRGRDYPQALCKAGVPPELGKPRGGYRLWFALALLVPWLAVFALVASVFYAGAVVTWAIVALGLALMTLLIGAVLARFVPAADQI